MLQDDREQERKMEMGANPKVRRKMRERYSGLLGELGYNEHKQCAEPSPSSRKGGVSYQESRYQI